MAAYPLDCATVDELAGLFVLDALQADEALAVREHLTTCDRAHEEFADMAAVTGALFESVQPVDAPPALRDRLMAAVAVTDQVPDDVAVVPRRDVQHRARADTARPRAGDSLVVAEPVSSVAQPVSLDAARRRRGPAPMVWMGLAAAAVIVIAALGVWNVALQRQVSDAHGQVASLQQAVTTAQQQAVDADAQLTSLQGRITQTEAQLTAALQRADTSDAQVASLQGKIDQMQVLVASYQQQIATADDRVALIGQAIAAATAPTSNVATLASTSPGDSAAGMAIFPASGPGYIMMEGLPEVAADQTYQAWYLAGGVPTSAGVMSVGPHGLAIVGGLQPISGTDTIALTVEPAGGVDQPTGSPVVVGKLPSAVALRL